MRFMHNALNEFILKLKQTVYRFSPNKKLAIRGLENLKTGKFQSLRTGKIQTALEDLASKRDVNKLELVVVPRIPETMHTVVIKGYDKDGNPKEAILENINIIHPTEDVELDGFEKVDDRRPTLGKH